MFFWQKHRISKKIKHFTAHWRAHLHANDDILQDKQKQAVGKALENLAAALPEQANAAMANAEGEIRRILPKKRFPLLREYLDVIAVAVVVAFGIRGLFLQPFKIPTSSMQPTLYGIHYVSESPRIAAVPQFLRYPLFSARSADLATRSQGKLDRNSITYQNGIFDRTVFDIGDIRYSLPGDPNKVMEYSGLMSGKLYSAGETICRGWLSLGDHLFVDRFSHHLVGLSRGDIVVFNTEGISADGVLLADTGYYYIKRLVGMPGDTLKIVNNQLFVKPDGAADFTHIAKLSPRFAKLYSNKGGYHGHLNLLGGLPGNYLSDAETPFIVPPDSYFMMGDNSMFSSDSRRWGVVPRKNIVGKACMVFWPFSRRWGLADRVAPADVATGKPGVHTFFSMSVE